MCCGTKVVNILVINTCHHQKVIYQLYFVNDTTIETPVSFAVEQLKTIGVCKKKQ